MKLPDQQLHFLMVPHQNTWLGALKWWLTRANKNCHSFCPSCPYYFRCQEDVELEKLNEGENKHVRY